MSLQEIKYGGDVESGILNDNFEYLDDRITEVGTSVVTVQSNLASVNSSLNSIISSNYSTLNTAMTEGFDSIEESLSNHTSNTSNPHSVTKAQIGLGNCNNTSDANKPISTATQTALNEINSNLSSHKNNKSNPHSVTKAQIGLGNVDNTSDLNKPLSIAAQNAFTSVISSISNISYIPDYSNGINISNGEACPNDGFIVCRLMLGRNWDSKLKINNVEVVNISYKWMGDYSGVYHTVTLLVGSGDVIDWTDGDTEVKFYPFR